jgi:hypothetical protein
MLFGILVRTTFNNVFMSGVILYYFMMRSINFKKFTISISHIFITKVCTDYFIRSKNLEKILN